MRPSRSGSRLPPNFLWKWFFLKMWHKNDNHSHLQIGVWNGLTRYCVCVFSCHLHHPHSPPVTLPSVFTCVCVHITHRIPKRTCCQSKVVFFGSWCTSLVSMYAYMYMYIYLLCIHMYIVYMHIYMYIYIYTHIYIYTYIHIYTHLCMYVYIYTYVYIYVCIYVYMTICTHM